MVEAPLVAARRILRFGCCHLFDHSFTGQICRQAKKITTFGSSCVRPNFNVGAAEGCDFLG
jgi:hypothetical protein